MTCTMNGCVSVPVEARECSREVSGFASLEAVSRKYEIRRPVAWLNLMEVELETEEDLDGRVGKKSLEGRELNMIAFSVAPASRSDETRDRECPGVRSKRGE